MRMKYPLHLLSLLFFLGCAEKDPGPEPRSRDAIMRDISSLPVLYMSKDGKKRKNAGRQGFIVDQTSREIFWMALECKNPNCPGRRGKGKPHIFISPDPGVYVDNRGKLALDPVEQENAQRKGELWGCQKCIPPRLQWMVSRGRGKEVQAEIIKYEELVVPHVLPESQNRQKELEQEMQARVAWEKENTP